MNSVPTSDTPEAKQYRLIPEQWGGKIMEAFMLDQPGIILAPTQERAEKWARQLKGTQHEVAVVSIQPLQQAIHVEKATIELKEKQGDTERSKVVTAFINSFGQQIIRYGQQVGEVVRKSAPTTTVVLRARTQAAAVSPEQWKACRKWTGPNEIKQFLKAQRPDLHVEDVFRAELARRKPLSYSGCIQSRSRSGS